MAAKASATNPPKSSGLANTSRKVKKGKGVTPVELPTYIVSDAEIIEGEGGADGGDGTTTASTMRVRVASDDAVVGAINETAPASDTASSGLNGRLQRIAQRLTTVVGHVDGVEALLSGPLTVGLPSGASTAANQSTIIGHLDGVETLLTAIDGRVDGLEALATTGNASLSVLDDWDESDRAKVNLVVGQAGISAGAGAVETNTPRVTAASDSPAVHPLVKISTSVTRPADTNVYAAEDAWADSTTAPTASGFTLTGAARSSGGGGIIRSANILDSVNAATDLQGEIWLFESSTGALNDNDAFLVSDGNAAKVCGVIAFDMATQGKAGGAANIQAHLDNLNIPFVCSGSANLRFLIKVKNAYTPASAEVLTVSLWIEQW